jgi:hypothetical protein
MKLLSITDEHGEVFNASFDLAAAGWYVDKNGSSTVFVPFSRSFVVNDITRFATTIQEAMNIGRLLIRLEEEAFTHFEKSHPELNP